MRLEVSNENGGKCAEGTQVLMMGADKGKPQGFHVMVGGNNCGPYGLPFQDLVHFSSKGQFDEAGQATLNGLDQQEQTPAPPETPPSLEPQPESHPLQLQAHEPTVVPTQSTMTADDMRQAKRIRVSREPFKILLVGFCGMAYTAAAPFRWDSLPHDVWFPPSLPLYQWRLKPLLFQVCSICL